MPRALTLLRTLRTYAALVRFSHTIFGLPFALSAAMLAHREAQGLGQTGLTWTKFALVLFAFTGARTAAMGFNRIVDRKIDGENPRTKDRELPRGAISLQAAIGFTIAACILFVASSFMLSPTAGVLSAPCLLIVLGYSLFKRFSWTAHLVLGIALALAPGGAWIAILGDFHRAELPLLLMLAVATWVAGFDVLYSLQDESFDREAGLHSIPSRFGIRGALWLSGSLHVGTIAALLAFHVQAALAWPHAIGVAIMAILLAYEHYLVKPNDLSRIDKAFFDLNGYASLAYLACVAIALFAI
jgi:4-hydroxybenzoate polyprenyltransferase